MTVSSKKVDKMMDRKVDLSVLKQPGTYLDMDEKLVLDIAKEYQLEEDSHYSSVSWPNQKRAQDYYNENGFEASLDRLFELRKRRESK
jgi:predicted GNAT family N-acyltransferase